MRKAELPERRVPGTRTVGRLDRVASRVRRWRDGVDRAAKCTAPMAFLVAMARLLSVKVPGAYEEFSFLWPWALWAVELVCGPVLVAAVLLVVVEKILKILRRPGC